jgi:hypothetical protein
MRHLSAYGLRPLLSLKFKSAGAPTDQMTISPLSTSTIVTLA